MLNMNCQDQTLARKVNCTLSCVLNVDKPANSEWLFWVPCLGRMLRKIPHSTKTLEKNYSCLTCRREDCQQASTA